MGQRHALTAPDSWVELRDPTELRAGDRMDIEDAIEGPGALRVQREITDGVITVLVTNWSLPLPIPSKSPDALRMLEIKDYVLLKKLVAPAEAIIFPADPEPEDPAALEAAKEDPASPTGDADAS
jgi:hypothetical protein